MRTNDALRILGLDAPATPADIKAAYRQRVKTSHPDRFGTDARLRAEAETELKQIIEAYQCLQRSDQTPDASTFTIHPMPASRPRRRRRPPSSGETRLWILHWARRAVVLVVELAVIVVLYRSFELWRSLQSIGPPELPLSSHRGAVDQIYQAPATTTLGPLVRSPTAALPPSSEAHESLGDRAACYTPDSTSDQYRMCLDARMLERRILSAASTTAFDSTPDSRKRLCYVLQAVYSEAEYVKCVAEVWRGAETPQ